MQYRFTYEAADLKEAQRVATRDGKSAGPGRGVVGWVVFVGLAVVLTYLLKHPPPAATSRTAAPAQAPLAELFVPLLPWLLVFAFLFVVFRVRLSVVRRSPLLQHLIEVDLSDDGVDLANGAVRTHWDWNGLDKLVETDRLFLMRQVGTRSWVALPKRAVTDPGELATVRNLLAAQVRCHVGAFPVLPVETPPA